MRMVLYGEKPYGTVPLLFILFQKIQRESASALLAVALSVVYYRVRKMLIPHFSHQEFFLRNIYNFINLKSKLLIQTFRSDIVRKDAKGNTIDAQIHKYHFDKLRQGVSANTFSCMLGVYTKSTDMNITIFYPYPLN